MEDLLLRLAAALLVGGACGQQQPMREELVNLRLCDAGSQPTSCGDLVAELAADAGLPQGRLTYFMSEFPGRTFAGTVRCVQAHSELECARLVLEGKADAVRVSAEQLYGLSKVRSFASALVPIAAGQTSESCSSFDSECHKFAREYSVAVVAKNAGIKQLGDLRDKKPCFGEVGDTSGWVIPVFKLLANWTQKPPFIVTQAEAQTGQKSSFQFASQRLDFGQRQRARRQAPQRPFWTNVSRSWPGGSRAQMGPVRLPDPTTPGRTAMSCPLDLSVVNDVFPQACAPGPWAKDQGLKKAFGERLCGACGGRGEDKCSAAAPQNAALNCLTSGRGDVALVSSRKLEAFFAGGGNEPEDFGFLCTQGLRDTDEFRHCHWGMVPEDAYVVKAAGGKFPPAVLGEYLHLLYNHVKGRAFRYQKGLPFMADSTVVASVARLDSEYELQRPPTIADYLQREGGENFQQAMAQSFPSCRERDVMRLCVVSREEASKCEAMQAAFAGAALPASLQCIVGYGVDSCVRMINSSQADMAWVPSHLADEFNHQGVVTPIMDEVEDQMAFAVAVTLQGNRVNGLTDLASGQINVCSSGTDSFAGWEAPNAALKAAGVISDGDCQLTEAWARKFRTSCVPGATNTSVTWGRNASDPISPSSVQGLCAGCGGGLGACLTPSQATDSAHQNYDTYYGDIGALRCLARRKADVAFVKSSAIKTILSLKSDTDFRSLTGGSLNLLCSDGSKKRSVDEMAVKSCHLGPVPDKWLVVRGDADLEQRRRWQDLWMTAFDRSRASFDWTKTRLTLQPGVKDHLLDLIFSNTTGALRRLGLNSSAEFLHNEAFDEWQSPFHQCAAGPGLIPSLGLVIAALLAIFK